MTRGQRGLNIVLFVAVAGLVAAGVASVGNPAKARAILRTASVQRGDVQATVSTTGNVTAPTTLALNFTTGGRMTEVDVTPGTRVVAGQVLARVEDASQKAGLASAQANLNAAQQRLFQAQNPLSSAQAAVNSIAAKQAAASVTAAQTSLADQQHTVAISATVYQGTVNTAETQLQADQAQLQADQAQSPVDQQKVNSDSQAVNKDQSALTSAQTAQTQGLARDEQALHSTQSALTAAQNSEQATLAGNALKAAPPLPGDLAADQAAIASAQTALTAAQLAEDGTVLTAPTAGTIASVNGQVGQTAAGGGSSASSASSASSGSGGTSGGGASSRGSSAGSTSQALVTLIDLDALQVKAGFSETDVARVAVGQPATVSFPALPNEQAAAHVVAIDATSTVVSNVVTYNVTMALDNLTPLVKPGMSANVSAVVAKADNVLHVPTAAVRGSGATATVTLINSGKQTPVVVTVGVRGDDSTEVTSGLGASDQVLVSTGQLSTSTGGATVRGVGGLGGGGLGGGGLGGGGLGGGARGG